MSGIESFTQINLEALRRNMWARAVNGELLGYSPLPESNGINDTLTNIMKIATRDYEGDPKANGHAHIEALGLSLDQMPAKDEIIKIHRKLAFTHHPDRNPNDLDAAKRFDRVQVAYKKALEMHAQAETAVPVYQARITKHFTDHQSTGGWKDALTNDGRLGAAFPIDHLSREQKQQLYDTLKTRGYQIEEEFSPLIGYSVAKFSKPAPISVSPLEMAQQLETIAKPGGLSEAVNAAENAASKAGGKAKWIIGGIVAATVAIGAVIAYKKKNNAERERERQQHKPVAHAIG